MDKTKTEGCFVVAAATVVVAVGGGGVVVVAVVFVCLFVCFLTSVSIGAAC